MEQTLKIFETGIE